MVQFSGKELDSPVSIWTSFPAQVTVTEQRADLLVCHFNVAAEAPVGVGALVISSPKGTSGPVWLLVDQMSAIGEPSGNHALNSAAALQLPVVVQGTVDGPEADYFAVELQEGQQLSLEVYASRLGSACDPVLRVLSEDGREMAVADDTPGWGAESQLRFTAVRSGRYIIELRDSSYRSGEWYLLRAGDFPVLATVYPLGVQRGATVPLSGLGANNERLGPIPFTAPLVDEGSSAVFRYRPDLPPGMVPLIVTDLPEYLEGDSDADVQSPVTIGLPCGVNGVLDRPDDQDCFRFAARKDQRWTFRATTRRLGSPAYPFLRILDNEGKVVAESPVGESEDLQLQWQVPADGVYLLSVEELTRRYGSSFSYRIQISEQPFQVMLKPAKESRLVWDVAQDGGAAVFDLVVQRFGYDGPIRVGWEKGGGPGEWFNAVIPARANQARVYWRPAEMAGALHADRLMAEADTPGGTTRQTVSTAGAYAQQTPAMVIPPLWFDGLVFVSVQSPQEPLVRWKTMSPAVELAAGGKLELNLEFERVKADYKEAPAVVVGQVGAGLEITGKVDKDNAVLTLQASPQIAPGKYSAQIGLFAAFQGRTQLLPLELAVHVTQAK
ncbi:MAG: hypothetical protein KatS3mg110_2174 [Pirellulaceae bacterium]|nr:MAG: hypothetical protein KatS3mg110_2174 [Pirellulaceae bacterium]